MIDEILSCYIIQSCYYHEVFDKELLMLKIFGHNTRL